jgi:hypothetical protein
MSKLFLTFGLIVSITFCFTTFLNAQSPEAKPSVKENVSPNAIPFSDIDKYITPAPIFPGTHTQDIPKIYIRDLIAAVISIEKEGGNDIKIYTHDSTATNPNEPANFITLINDGKVQGFQLINPKDTKDTTAIIFSFTCSVTEVEDSLICDHGMLLQMGVNTSIEDAFNKNPIFQKAVLDSKNPKWSQSK